MDDNECNSNTNSNPKPIPVLVINLDKRPERWKTFQENYSTALQSDSLLQFYVAQTPERLSAAALPEDPARGCCSSHLRAIQLAQERNYDQVLVFEDDGLWAENAGVKLQAVLQELTLTTNALVVFFGAGTAKRIGFQSPHLGVLLKDGNLTSTHTMLYRKMPDTGYTKIIETLEHAVGPDSWCSHIDLAISQTFSGTRQVFVAIPYVAKFVENGTTDVRPGKGTAEDYGQLQETEECLIQAMSIAYAKQNSKNF